VKLLLGFWAGDWQRFVVIRTGVRVSLSSNLQLRIAFSCAFVLLAILAVLFPTSSNVLPARCSALMNIALLSLAVVLAFFLFLFFLAYFAVSRILAVADIGCCCRLAVVVGCCCWLLLFAFGVAVGCVALEVAGLAVAGLPVAVVVAVLLLAFVRLLLALLLLLALADTASMRYMYNIGVAVVRWSA